MAYDIGPYVQPELELGTSDDDWLAASTASACSIDDPECEACQ